MGCHACLTTKCGRRAKKLNHVRHMLLQPLRMDSQHGANWHPNGVPGTRGSAGYPKSTWLLRIQLPLECGQAQSGPRRRLVLQTRQETHRSKAKRAQKELGAEWMRSSQSKTVEGVHPAPHSDSERLEATGPAIPLVFMLEEQRGRGCWMQSRGREPEGSAPSGTHILSCPLRCTPPMPPVTNTRMPTECAKNMVADTVVAPSIF